MELHLRLLPRSKKSNPRIQNNDETNVGRRNGSLERDASLERLINQLEQAKIDGKTVLVRQIQAIIQRIKTKK